MSQCDHEWWELCDAKLDGEWYPAYFCIECPKVILVEHAFTRPDVFDYQNECIEGNLKYNRRALYES